MSPAIPQFPDNSATEADQQKGGEVHAVVVFLADLAGVATLVIAAISNQPLMGWAVLAIIVAILFGRSERAHKRAVELIRSWRQRNE